MTEKILEELSESPSQTLRRLRLKLEKMKCPHCGRPVFDNNRKPNKGKEELVRTPTVEEIKDELHRLLVENKRKTNKEEKE